MHNITNKKNILINLIDNKTIEIVQPHIFIALLKLKTIYIYIY